MVSAARPNGVEGVMLPPDEPTSPREPRRSGRRSLPLVQTSGASSSTPKSSQSNSPGHEEQPSPIYQTPHPTKKRKNIKDEAEEGSLLDYKPSKREDGKGNKRERLAVDTKSLTGHQQGKGRGKRKSKAGKGEKMVETPVEEVVDPPAIDGEDPDGRTRCICGNTTGTADEDDDLTFWIQCETCKVWQHGRCVGYEKESDAPEHYHCEECRPDLHEELGRMSRTTKARHPSMRPSRSSRSHSPHGALAVLAMQAQQAPKRRNTMNSRVTAYHDDLMKQVQEDDFQPRGESLTAPERASVGASSIHPDEEIELRDQESSYKKKRRSLTAPAVDQQLKARSESSASDQPILASMIVDQQVPLPAEDGEEEVTAQTTPAPKRKRGSRKEAADKRHPNQYTYRRGQGPRDGNKNHSAQNSTPQTPTPGGHEHGTRRNPISTRGSNLPPPQPLLTTWGLPDYLSHLSPLLPTPLPLALQIPVSSAGGVRYEEERGVKVKWPGKRMGTVDMVKRCRQLMEWVGREQANHSDREKRKLKIDQAVAEEATAAALRATNGELDSEVTKMEVDAPQEISKESSIPGAESTKTSSLMNGTEADPSTSRSSINGHNHKPADPNPSGAPSEKPTALLMEELMEELIGFQEKYGAQTKMSDLMSL